MQRLHPVRMQYEMFSRAFEPDVALAGHARRQREGIPP